MSDDIGKAEGKVKDKEGKVEEKKREVLKVSMQIAKTLGAGDAGPEDQESADAGGDEAKEDEER